jgi:hypothetical protein
MKQFPTEEKSEEKAEDVKKSKDKPVKTLVVSEFPTQQVREVVGEDQQEYVLIDKDTALTEILEIVRLLKKGLI